MKTRHISNQDGLSFLEATIILMILFLLTAVLSPAVTDYVNDARQTKGKEDVEAIGLSIMRLLRDTGLPFPVVAAGAAPLHTAVNRVDLLVSDGNTPSAAAGTGVSSSGTGYIITANRNWDDVDGAGDNVANMNPHLAYNMVDPNGLT